MTALAWVCTIAGMLLVTVGGLWLAVRLLRGNAVSRDGQTQPPRRKPAPKGMADGALWLSSNGTLWRVERGEWVEHIEDLPTPNERPTKGRGNRC